MRAQKLVHALGRGLGIGAAAAHRRAGQAMERGRHLRRLGHRRDAVQRHRAVDHERAFAGEQQHWQAAGRDDDLRPRRDKRPDLSHELGADLGVGRLVGEGAHESRQVGMDRPHAGRALLQAECPQLPLVPVDEDRIDGDEAEPAPHGQRRQHAGLAEANDGDVDGTPDFQQAGLLEMADDESIVTGSLGLQRHAPMVIRPHSRRRL